jgi:hypothetical protein
MVGGEIEIDRCVSSAIAIDFLAPPRYVMNWLWGIRIPFKLRPIEPTKTRIRSKKQPGM